ncbi:ATP-binding protein [Sphingomonas sp. ZB1N12]
MANPPDAAALMMSARSFGNYDLPSALADLIDNSIKARAHNVYVTCVRSDTSVEVRIRDDGEGMSASELSAAMRPASANPEHERSPDDLGRFGWGLKSASFSQCRRLTVVSNTGEGISGAEWDLDRIEGWSMALLEQDDLADVADPLIFSAPGTEVIWRHCDRLSEGGTLNSEAFNALVVHARARLSLLFHRFLAGDVRGRSLKILLNGQSIAPFDPFHRENNATQALSPEEVHLPDGSVIGIHGYVLPHFSKLALSDYDRLGGEEGFLRNQGFYVYRAGRLIINGTWFRLVRHGELSQLVRVAIDIPNSLDAMWKITVDKADAQLPSLLRDRLRALVAGLRRGSAEAFRSRGGRLSSKSSVAVWSKYARGGRIRYYVNRDHPLVASLLQNPDAERGRAAAAAITLIEQQFPAVTIGEDVVSTPDAMSQGEFDARAFLETFDAALPALLSQAGTMKKLGEALVVTEPWSAHGALVRDHLRKKGWTDAVRE